MSVRTLRMLPAVALALMAACSSKSDGPPTPTGPMKTPLTGTLQVGDLVRVNVNGTDACTNPTYHVARVAAVGSKALILADTLNPAGGFTATDYAHYAAKFDTLVYPLDVGAFGAPTDIDNNGHVGIIFTRAVNELTPKGSTSYVGGFTFSRDLFPVTANSRVGTGCPASNEGEFFYVLAPDPTGVVNGNVRTTGFVDTNTTAVLAHEFQHLINASRRIYVNTAAQDFETGWLDEGLAHTAEELLFYRESGLAPRMNLDAPAIRASNRSVNAFNLDMLGNTGRYSSYLGATVRSSPYLPNRDSLPTRGAAWSFLRYLTDQKINGVTHSAGGSIIQRGPGTVTLPGGTTGAEYSAVVGYAPADTLPNLSADFTITAGNVVPPAPFVGSTLLPSLSLSASLAASSAEPTRDLAFEARLRAAERAILPSKFSAARSWYRSRPTRSLLVIPSGPTYDVAPFTSPDGDIWSRLVNSTTFGIANLQNVFGTDIGSLERDFTGSLAVDDAAATSPEFRQPSWNFRSIYGVLRSNSTPSYPLQVQTMTSAVPYSATLIPGGASFYKLAVPAAGNATLTLASPSPDAARLHILIIRTK